MGNLINYINQENSATEQEDKIFQRVLTRTFAEEGGYEDRKHKIEQPTNMGITQSTLSRFKNSNPQLAKDYPAEVKNLTSKQAEMIYKKDYFDPYHIGQIKHKPLQETMFDSFVNHSPKGPSLWAQQAINKHTSMKVKEDGIFGPRTVSALNRLNEGNELKNVNNYILDKRLEDRNKQIKQQGYLYQQRTTGIPNRINRFRIK